jgi:hypothetical protein
MQPEFLEADFTYEFIHLNRMILPTFSATSSHSHSAPKPTELTFPIPPMSCLSPRVACTDYPLFHKPIKTYCTLSTATSKTFSSTEPFIPFGCVNEQTCGVKLRSISLLRSSPQRKARHYVITTLDLNRVAELTPRKKKLYNMI